MRYLIDTNVLIPLEPTSPENVEQGTAAAAELVRVLTENGYQVLIHPASLHDLERDRDGGRRELRRLLMRKYPQLEDPPAHTRVQPPLQAAPEGTNDWVDHALLAAIAANAVSMLVTEDAGIHRKAALLGVADRVATVQDAFGQLTTLLAASIPQPPPPEALDVPLHSLDLADPIFRSLRADYGEFDQWFARCAQQGRRAYVVPATARPLTCAALCIIKPGFDDEFGLGPRAVKASTFKVADEFAGNRYGELLLKALLRRCNDLNAARVWLTAFDRHEPLIALLEQFGFFRLGQQTVSGEGIYVKDLLAPSSAQPADPFDRHVAFGPPHLSPSEDHVFIIPIRPYYHALLFADAERERPLLVESRPFGCAIRKAYLCHSACRSLARGDTVLFYRSHQDRGVWTVGIVEESFVSCDADEIAERVGTRTVYSLEEIRQMAKRDVLVILFRQDRVLSSYIPEGELVAHGVITRGPQSIVRAKPGTAAWLNDRISA